MLEEFIDEVARYLVLREEIAHRRLQAVLDERYLRGGSRYPLGFSQPNAMDAEQVVAVRAALTRRGIDEEAGAHAPPGERPDDHLGVERPQQFGDLDRLGGVAVVRGQEELVVLEEPL